MTNQAYIASMVQKAKAAVDAAKDEASREKLIEQYTSDDAFDAWYDGFNEALTQSVESK